MKSFVVVGSGIGGLSAAYVLQKTGFTITVLEEKHLPGGRMAEERVGSFMNITGASGLNPWYREMFDLCDELGHGDCLEKLSSFGIGTATDGNVLFPMSNAPTRYELLRSPVLSLRSKLRLATLLPDIRRARRRVDPCLTGPKNIYYVGDYLSGAGTGCSCALGRRTGRLIASHWRE